MNETPENRQLEVLRIRLDKVIAGRDALLATVRREGDSEARARTRLPATLAQALDELNDEIADIESQLDGNPPTPPIAR